MFSYFQNKKTKRKCYNAQNHFYYLYNLRQKDPNLTIPQWVHDTAELSHMNLIELSDAIRFLSNMK